MKRTAYFVLILLVLAIISGVLLSEMSLVGKVGIKLIHKEYTFLKTWYKGTAIVFVTWILLFMIQVIILRTAKRNVSHIVNVCCMLGALVGLYFTYDDFRHTLSHRWLGERFHLGAYMFWLVWIVISLYVMLQKKPLPAPVSIEPEIRDVQE